MYSQIIDKFSKYYNYQLISENLNNKRNHMILLSSNDNKHIEKIITECFTRNRKVLEILKK